MESELENLPKLQSVSVLAMLRPQVTLAFFFFLSFCLSVILASIIPSHHVCGLDIVFSGKAHDAASDRAANNEEQEQIRAHGHDESSYPEPELLAGCDTDFPSSSCRADEALKTCE